MVTRMWDRAEKRAIATRRIQIVRKLRFGEGVKLQLCPGMRVAPIPDSTTARLINRITMLLGLSLFLSCRRAALATPPSRAVASPIPWPRLKSSKVGLTIR